MHYILICNPTTDHQKASCTHTPLKKMDAGRRKENRPLGENRNEYYS